MSDLEKTDKFIKTEKRLLRLKRKLEERIARTDEAMIEAKKIGEELKKLRKEKKASR